MKNATKGTNFQKKNRTIQKTSFKLLFRAYSIDQIEFDKRNEALSIIGT